MADVTIKAGDRLTVRRQLQDGDGNGVDLTGATVMFAMSLIRGSRESVLADEASLVDVEGEDGWVEFSSDETDDLADDGVQGYRGDFVATFAGGAEQTFPGDPDITINVRPRATAEAGS